MKRASRTKQSKAKKPATPASRAKQRKTKKDAPKPQVDSRRFERAKDSSVSGSGAGSWKPPKRFGSTLDTEFLGRLWALFGEPSGDNGKGFEYVLRDVDTGELVMAFTGASGPWFGTPTGTRNESVEALQALINATKPVDCETTVDYGASKIGIKAGKHFYDYDGPEDDSFAD